MCGNCSTPMDILLAEGLINFALFIIVCPLIVYPLKKWIIILYEGLRIRIIEDYYWARFKSYYYITSCNLSLILATELFDGPSKCIRLSKQESEFSPKHKKTLVDNVMHNKYIGTITLRKKYDNYGVYYHEVVDGNSRLIALNDYMKDRFSWNHKRFSELSGEKRLAFLEYKMSITYLGHD